MCLKPILIGGGGASFGQRFAKDETGIAALTKALRPPHPAWFEPTGRSHIAPWRGLARAGHRTEPPRTAPRLTTQHR